jgi:hypothetical protein
MGRVIRTETAARDRRQLLQGLGAALARAADPKCAPEEQGDILGFSALSLRELSKGVDTSASAWEGRGYWLKADKFRREWGWAADICAALDASLEAKDLGRAALAAARMAPHLASVHVPARMARSRPWQGALQRYQELVSGTPTP